jgi:hypothetical protein
VVGAGIIGLPGAFNEGGFTPSIILSFVVELLSYWSIRRRSWKKVLLLHSPVHWHNY